MTPANIFLIAGPDDYPNRDFVWAKLDALAAAKGDIVILTGGHPEGVEAHAREWCFIPDREHTLFVVPARRSHLSSARAMQIGTMMAYLPHGVLIFGDGCEDVKASAVRMEVPVMRARG
jgi:hypothetical protein